MHKRNPIISVIIPAYNAEMTLGRTISSVLAQTCNDWALIVVDDGSTDGTLTLAQKLATNDARITVLHQKNAGSASALNTGIASATTEWISFVDADDELDPRWMEALKKMVDEHPGYLLYGSNLLIISPEHPEGLPCFPKDKLTEIDLTAFLTQWCFSNNGAWMRRESWQQLGGLKEDSYCEDYDLIAKSLISGKALRSPDTLYIYHRGHAGRKSDIAPPQRVAEIETCISLITKNNSDLDGATLHAACQRIIASAQALDTQDPRSAAVVAIERENAQAANHTQQAKRFTMKLRRSLYHLSAAIIGESRARKVLTNDNTIV